VPQVAEIHARIDLTVDWWRRWSATITYDGPHRNSVRRSALTLKALTVAPYDGIAAALTTSLPEKIGGQRNFDYRFAWVRDASFALDAMTRLGLSEEVHAALSWLLRAVEHTAPDVRALYTLDGEPAPAEMTSLSELPGYRGSSPVHRGNSAASQTQLGGFGDLMDAAWRYTTHDGYLDVASAASLAALADRTCDLWRGKDAGIWELGNADHYTISKIGCWVALDRATRLAEAANSPARTWTGGGPNATQSAPGPSGTAGHPASRPSPFTPAPTNSTPPSYWRPAPASSAVMTHGCPARSTPSGPS
jgi:GH15 family glucan-1,4-alpha-glucosidase